MKMVCVFTPASCNNLDAEHSVKRENSERQLLYDTDNMCNLKKSNLQKQMLLVGCVKQMMFQGTNLQWVVSKL